MPGMAEDGGGLLRTIVRADNVGFFAPNTGVNPADGEGDEEGLAGRANCELRGGGNVE